MERQQEFVLDQSNGVILNDLERPWFSRTHATAELLVTSLWRRLNLVASVVRKVTGKRLGIVMKDQIGNGWLKSHTVFLAQPVVLIKLQCHKICHIGDTHWGELLWRATDKPQKKSSKTNSYLLPYKILLFCGIWRATTGRRLSSSTSMSIYFRAFILPLAKSKV